MGTDFLPTYRNVVRGGPTAGLAAVVLLAAGCGGNSSSSSTTPATTAATTTAAAQTPPAVATTVVRLTDAGCPRRLEVAGGARTFVVRNVGAEKVSEFEVLQKQRVLGEAENVDPGESGRFTLTLDGGEYVTYCPGGTSSERGVLVVSGGRVGPTTAAARKAASTYRTYLVEQAALLRSRTVAFTEAIVAGDRETAKSLYASTRAPYERIEPVAESFGGLDPAIDARAGDVPAAKWTGFHPLEQMLWEDRGTQAQMNRLARKLTVDVAKLDELVANVELEPAQIANGSVELLGEVSKSKITGEEERYSHTDLDDFEANVDGARAAFLAVRTIVAGKQPALAATIDTRFADVTAALAPYKSGFGFVPYTDLTPADTRKLSRAIDALAEPLSNVAAIVAVTQ
jgi:iron uptake system component EfeO